MKQRVACMFLSAAMLVGVEQPGDYESPFQHERFNVDGVIKALQDPYEVMLEACGIQQRLFMLVNVREGFVSRKEIQPCALAFKKFQDAFKALSKEEQDGIKRSIEVQLDMSLGALLAQSDPDALRYLLLCAEDFIE